MAFWEGVLAGFGIAIPVGAIAILIINQGLQRGFRSGFMAGAGAASVDTLYAAAAIITGATVVSVLRSYTPVLQAAGGTVLIGFGSYGIINVWRNRNKSIGDEDVDERGYAAVYTRFFGLTLLNPLTVIYFSAMIIGLGSRINWSGTDNLIFVLGAGVASLAWQTFLAAGGATARHYFSPKLTDSISLVGNMIVIAMGLRILIFL